MKIAFWGGEHGCGTTSNMFVIATLLAVRYDYSIALASAKSIGEARFFDKTGIPEMSENDVVKEIIENRLYFVHKRQSTLVDTGAEKTEKRYEYIQNYFNRKMDFVFTDYGAGTDEWTKKQLRQADLTVINFNQSSKQLNNFFGNDFYISNNQIYFFSNYQKNSIYNRKKIHSIYRINPKKMAVIPYNPEFAFACMQGKLDRYVKTSEQSAATEQRYYFFRELEHTLQVLMENIGYF